MTYPKTPPATELTEQTKAIFQAFVGAARTIGINKISGGIGKNELSVKDIRASSQSALG